MKIKFIIEKGNIGSDKIIINPSILKFDNPIPLLLEWKQLIGEAIISLENGILFAESDFEMKYEGFYPAIGFSIKQEKLIDSDIWEIKDAKLINVSLCQNPNCDKTILPIKFNHD